MKIRTLLLGSAAALVAVSSARAADAIVIAEPEPMEYVRVCDAYGAGYFYIPGTETCLKVSGFVWYQVGTESFRDNGDTPDFLTYGGYPGSKGWLKTVRARVEFDARSSTEWGTLRGFIRLQSDFESTNTSTDGPLAVENAFIQLGGLRMGYTESVWNDSIGAGAASYGSHSWGSMSYGDQKRHQISYTFGSSDGFAATLSLEDDALDGRGYVPDVVVAASYNAGWGAVWGKVGYDESEKGFGVTGGLQVNVPNMTDSSFRLIGYYSDRDNAYGVGSPYSYFGGYGASEWSAIASYYHQFTDTFGASVGYQYFSDFYQPESKLKSGLHGHAAELALVWTPVENLEVRAEAYYDKYETFKGTGSGFLRFTRSF